MAYGIGAAATRLARLVTGGVDAGHCARLALVLRLENVAVLRASIGQARLDQVLDRLTLRLVAGLRLLPQTRGAGATEILGAFANPQALAIPELTQRVQRICRAGVDLQGLRIVPVVHGVIVGDDTGRHDLGALYAVGRTALRDCDPLGDPGQIRHIAMPGDGGDPQQARRPSALDLGMTFQPQLCCDTGRIAALRARVQIGCAGGDAVDLADIQSRLDDERLTELIHAGLRLALSALRGWDRLGTRVPFVSMALPDAVLADAAFADMVAWELDRLELDPDRLELEVTDPIGQGGGRLPVSDSLGRLAQAGCRIALGDFGTGSAGLADIRRFGIGRVRIGREFTAACDRRGDQQRMILAIIALAEHLNVATLGDGVQTQEEFSFLSQIGFDAVQGGAVAPWLDAAGIDTFLMERDRALAAIPALRPRARG